MLEPAFITLQAIMNKAAEMREHYQAIAPRIFRQCCACLDRAQQTSLCGQEEMSDHQGKHALETGKQALMDGVKEVSGFQKENEMYF